MLVAVGRWRWTKLRPPLGGGGGGGWVVGSLYDAVAPDLKVVLQNMWKGHEYFFVFAEVSEEVE